MSSPRCPIPVLLLLVVVYISGLLILLPHFVYGPTPARLLLLFRLIAPLYVFVAKHALDTISASREERTDTSMNRVEEWQLSAGF